MNIAVNLQKCGVALSRIIPFSIADKIALLIGGLCYFLLKKRRCYILKNLHYTMKKNPELHSYLCRKTFENFARCMLDFFRLSFLNKDKIIEQVNAQGLDNLDTALKLKKGCILLTLHIGNWDFAGCYLASLGYPVNALVEETVPEMFALYTRHREATGLKTYPLSKSTQALLDTIKNNRILAVLSDRDITKQGKVLDFFGGKRSFPTGIGGIISKRKIPVVFGYMVLNKKGSKKRYLGVVEPAQIFDNEKEFHRYMIDRFEGVIRRYPDQWFVFHQEWIE